MSGFLDLTQFPAAAVLADQLIAECDRIGAEGRVLAESGRFAPWPEPINTNNRWYVFGIKWQGALLPASDGLTAHRVVRDAGELVLNAGYSLMLPGAEIAPHEGYTGDVVRLHIGLDVPEGDCALCIGGECRQWENGKAMLFDDTLTHSAHNRTNHARLILLLDLMRSRLGGNDGLAV